MSRKFSKREKVMLLILAVLLVCCGYYLLVFQPVADIIARADLRRQQAEDTILVEEIKASRLAQMKAELAALEEDQDGRAAEIADYDNVQSVVRVLNAALAAAESYNLTFNPVTFQEHIASRPIDMTFTCADYQAARAIVSDLYHAPYRCQISALSMSTQTGRDAGDLLRDQVSARLTITFYEYIP